MPLLSEIDDQTASQKPAPNKWSPKEIIGHLIDSATNNQQKFIRCIPASGVFFPAYEQDAWVSLQHYNEVPWLELLSLWQALNRHIAHVIRHIPHSAYLHNITIGNAGPFTLEFIARDYPEHLKHHLRTILPTAAFLENHFRMVY
jgi:hypothetical protein